MSESPEHAVRLTSPQELVDKRKLIEAKLKEAKEQLDANRYSDSLKTYRWIFANCDSEQVSFFSGDAQRLARKYPPAQKLLTRWRNDKEKLILAGEADRRLIREWSELNESLNEKSRTVTVFRKLVSEGACEDTRNALYGVVWNQLHAARSYEELRGYLPTLAWLLFLHASNVDSNLLFPDENKSKSDQKYWLVWERNMLVEHGVKVFEVALGLGEIEAARTFARKLTNAEPSDRCFALLVKAACRAKNYDEAQEVFEEALRKVKNRRIPLTRKAILKVPKSKLKKTT